MSCFARTLAVLSLFAAALAGTPGGLLYDNLGDSTLGGFSVDLDGPLYASFTNHPLVPIARPAGHSVPISGYGLDHVQVKLMLGGVGMNRPQAPALMPILLDVGYFKPVAAQRSKASPSGLRPHVLPLTGSITVGLYSDNSTHPGALLTVIGTLPDTSLSLTPTDFNFPLNSAYPLSTNHRYWIGISTSNGSLAVWSTATDDTGLGVANEFWDANGTISPNTDPPFQMQVLAVPQAGPAPAPVPPSILLSLAGVAAMALYLNRRKLGLGR